MRRCAALILVLVCLALPAAAAERVTLGFGHLLTGNAGGDGANSRRSAGLGLSMLRGAPGQAGLPEALGTLIEYRLRFDVVGAADPAAPAPQDRPYVGLVSLGAHTYADVGGMQVALGGDLVLVGPTGLVGEVHAAVAEALGQPPPAETADRAEAVYPTATVEVARSVAWGAGLELRPFVEAAAGVETYVRLGGDLRLGATGRGDVLLRDPVTGQRYRSGGAGGAGGAGGISAVLGADTARVFDSHLDPAEAGARSAAQRTRLRAGLSWEGAAASAFTGVTWLREDFRAEPEAQAVGSLQLRLRF